jgi:hypothetical protein
MLDDCRRSFAEGILAVAGLKSAPLVDAFMRVHREEFLGPRPWKYVPPELASSRSDSTILMYRATEDPRDLYRDVLVAIDANRGLNNGQPSSLACWIDALDLKPGDRVFHLGCGPPRKASPGRTHARHKLFILNQMPVIINFLASASHSAHMESRLTTYCPVKPAIS